MDEQDVKDILDATDEDAERQPDAVDREAGLFSLQALYTKAEAAKLLAISVRTLDRMIAARDLAVVRPGGAGGHVRIPQAELERLAAGK